MRIYRDNGTRLDLNIDSNLGPMCTDSCNLEI